MKTITEQIAEGRTIVGLEYRHFNGLRVIVFGVSEYEHGVKVAYTRMPSGRMAMMPLRSFKRLFKPAI